MESEAERDSKMKRQIFEKIREAHNKVNPPITGTTLHEPIVVGFTFDEIQWLAAFLLT